MEKNILKTGDIVRIKPCFQNAIWYSNKTFTIVSINEFLRLVDLDSIIFNGKRRILIEYLELDIKEIRKQKINKLCSI